MTKLVLISVVADGAQVVVSAFGAFPADAEDGLLAAGVTHGSLVLDSRGGAVEYSQIELA